MSSSYLQRHDDGYMGRRGIALVLIALLHAVVIWAFLNGFAAKAIKRVKDVIEASTVEQVKPKDLPPPPPQEELKQEVKVQVVAPDIDIKVPVDAPPPPITNTTTQPVVKAPPAPPPPKPSGPTTGLGKATYAPDPNDYYPDDSKRNGEEGRPIVHVCADAKGRVSSAEILTSSGHPSLDTNAIKYAKAIRFKPALENGQPVPACGNLPVKFSLKDAG